MRTPASGCAIFSLGACAQAAGHPRTWWQCVRHSCAFYAYLFAVVATAGWMGHRTSTDRAPDTSISETREPWRTELLDELPDSLILLNLLPHLNREEKKGLRSCCQRLRVLVNSTMRIAHIQASDLPPAADPVDSAAAASTLGGRFPHLTQLTVSDCGSASVADEDLLSFTSGSPVLAQLAVLDVKRCHHLSPAALVTLLACCPRLGRLSTSRWAGHDTLKALAAFPHIQELDLGDGEVDVVTVDDLGLAALAAVTGLRVLRLTRCRWLSDAAFLPLAALEQLEELDLAGTEVGEEGLGHLLALPNLRTINLSQCRRVDDRCLVVLAGAASLTSIALADTSISNSGLAHLRGMSQLAALDLGWRFEVTDEGLDHLAACHCLTSLRAGSFNLVDTSRSPAGARGGGRGLAALEHLSFGGAFANKGLHLLFPLPRLTSLHVQGIDSVTDGLMATLRRQTSLTRLSLRSGYTLTEAGLAPLAELPHLAELSISACPAISSTFLGAFVAAEVSLGQLLTSCCTAMRFSAVAQMTAGFRV